MKKLVILAVALIAAFSLTACEVSFVDSGGAQAPITSLSPSSGDTTPSPTSGAEQPDTTTPSTSETSESPTSAAPSATEPKQGEPIFTTDKAKYAPGETITQTVSGVTQTMVDDMAWIGIFRVGAPHDGYSDYVYIEAGSSVAEINAPEEIGNYELRMFKEDFNYVAEALLHTVPFTVE